MPLSPYDPANLTPEQRRREIAAILARGILRLRSILPSEPAPCPAGPPESEEAALRCPAPPALM